MPVYYRGFVDIVKDFTEFVEDTLRCSTFALVFHENLG